MSAVNIPFDKPAHSPRLMTSTLGEETVDLTCLEIACENRLQTTDLEQDCHGTCHGNYVVLTCADGAEGKWGKI